MSGGEERDWSVYPDFGSLLRALMEDRGFTSDKDLAALARRYKPWHDLSDGKTIGNWKNGKGPGRSRDSRAMLNQVRKALAVPGAVSPLGRAWDARLGEVYAKPSEATPPNADTSGIVDATVVTQQENEDSSEVSKLIHAEAISPNYGENLKTSNTSLNLMSLDKKSIDTHPSGNWILFKINLFRAAGAIFRAHLNQAYAMIGIATAILAISVSVWMFRTEAVDDQGNLGRKELPYKDLHLSSGDFVLPRSSLEPISFDNLRGLNTVDTYVARNEIFARNGNPMKTLCLHNHFSRYLKKSDGSGWYEPKNCKVDYDQLSKIERDNVDEIQRYEALVLKNSYSCKND